MTEPCRNECSDPVTFPKIIRNRPGLPHIDFRIGTYSDFLDAMLSAMDHDETLENWTHREGDDPGIALLEGASVLGDILTFYQELYANEAFLRTAQWRESVGDLVRLVGYRLSPGLAGSSSFAVEVKKGDPITIPAGFQVKAQLEGSDTKMEFETTTELTAYHGLSSLTLYRPSSIPSFSRRVTQFSLKTATLESSGMKVAAGDSLILLTTSSQVTTNVQIVEVKEVTVDLDRTNITIKGYWDKGNGLSSVHVYKLGRTFRHFGHTSPSEVVEVTSGMAATHAVTYSRKVGSSTSSTGHTTIEPSIAYNEIPLDSEAKDIATGCKLIIRSIGGTDRTVVRTVMGTRQTSMTWGAQTGSTTIITIDRRMDMSTTSTDIRQLILYETTGSRLLLYPVRTIETGSDGTRLDTYIGPDDYLRLDSRTMILQKEGTSMETTVTIDQEETDDDGELLRPLYLSAPLSGEFSLGDFPIDLSDGDPLVTAFGNVIKATQGKSEKDTILGNGDSRQLFQSFMLPKSPLTYLNDASGDPPETPEIEIFVDDIKWTRVSTLFDSKHDDEIYIVREDEDGNSWIQFGDGITGKRLPSGIKNVMARYRTGSGAFGSLKEGTTARAGSKLKGIDKIHLPGTVAGGCEAESADNAREAAPGKIQSLGRLVSLRDFETEVLGIAGVSKAKVSWELIDNVPSIVMTVLMDSGRDEEIEQIRSTISTYNRSRGPQRYPIIVVPGSRKNIYLDITFGIDPSYQEDLVKEAISTALGLPLEGDEAGTTLSGSSATFTADSSNNTGLFHEPIRAFGQPEYATRVAGIIQNVDGVVWAEVKAMGTLEPPVPRIRRPNRFTLKDQRHVQSGGLRSIARGLTRRGMNRQPGSLIRRGSTRQGTTQRLADLSRLGYTRSPAKLYRPSRIRTDRLPLRKIGPEFLTLRLPMRRVPASERVIICDAGQILILDHEDLTLNAVSTPDMEVYSDE